MTKNLINSFNPKRKEVKRMKRIMLLLVGLFLLIGSTSAYAFFLPAGEWNAHFSDFDSVYHNGVGQSIAYIPQVGDYFKGVFNLDQIVPKGGGLPAWSPSTHEQLAGLEYNFVFLGIVGVPGSGSEKTYWGAPAGQQSTVDIYQRDPFVWNTGATFAPRTGPEAVDTGADNGVPGIGNPIAGISDAGSSLFLGLHLLLNPDQTFPGATLVITGNILTGVASGDIYADVYGGSFASTIEHQILGPAQIPADMYLKFSSNGNAPLYGWGVRSEDPAEFSTIPEPATILLLGSGLLGVAFVGRKRRSKKV